jgi:D-alanyl-D-alanine carboxypeptidase
MFFAYGMHQRRRLLLGLVVTALAAVLVSGCGGGGATQEEEEEESAADTTAAAAGGGGEQASEADLDAALEKSFQESAAPGVVAAVQTPEYTWIRALGVADRTSEEPMTSDVHHRIGSVTKTFTISLLLQAEAEGLLSLDDTIDQYYEGVPNGDESTLRQMANMTSGVANYTKDDRWGEEQSSDPHRVWEPEELAQVGIKDSPLFDPGTEWHYSNTNTVILGLVLEQVTGHTANESSSHSASKTPHSQSSRTLPFPSRMPRATLSKVSLLVGNPSTLPTGAPQRHGRPAR